MPYARDAIRRLDPFGLLPEWRFFAPVPGRSDYYLLYRDELGDGATTAWREVVLERPRRWCYPVWNPGRRERKALVDLVADLGSATEDGRVSPLSLPYLSLLWAVSELPRAPSARSRQFMLMASTGARARPEPIFCSARHTL